MMKNEWSIESNKELLFPQHLATILTIDHLAANGSLKAESFQIKNGANSSRKYIEQGWRLCKFVSFEPRIPLESR